jgi:hypothetical protein
MIGMIQARKSKTVSRQSGRLKRSTLTVHLFKIWQKIIGTITTVKNILIRSGKKVGERH